MNCLKPNPERLERRKYTPHDINLCDWNQVRSIYEELLNRPIDSVEALEKYYLDVSDFNSALTEEFCRIQLASSIDTADNAARNRFQHFNAEIMAPASEYSTRLDNRFLDSPFNPMLDPERTEQLQRLLKNSRDLFRIDNVPLQVEDSQCAEEYNQIAGGMSVEFQGKRRNLTEMSVFLKSTDRSVRENAWRETAACRMNHVEKINHIFDRMITIRHQMAKNAGFQNFRDFRHLRLNRFDYEPADCARFHDTIEACAVEPFLERQALRRERLGLDRLRPWDMSVDVFGREPLMPFTTQDELVAGCAAILDRVYPRLGDTLRLLQAYGNLDLMTRQNKAPVGFNMPLDETRVSFIFMNATGHHSDVIVLLHESGHAIETRACINQAIFQYRHTPQEWGECASQAMELLALDHLDVFYPDPDDRKRCIIDKLEDILRSLVYTARIDAFQHWVYTHPDATADQRADQWTALSQRFPTGADPSGLDSILRWNWQAIPHLFIVPFYYIEYGIAQLGALQVYRKSRSRGFAALEEWLNTMKLGNSRPIPELYERAGLQFEFHGDVAKELIAFVVDEINRLEQEG
ncbi:MAG TPA: M3 family oligoendopeptidase [bacterium]|nr:M3 family oligoendopeptidase [bacterium]